LHAGPVSYGAADGPPDAWMAIVVRAAAPAQAGLDE
jgi:hypothetical protein